MYYLKNGDRIGNADFVETCARADHYEDHDPHVWNWTRMGETDKVCCPGYPHQKIYDTPKRRPVRWG